jgi:hypothetical protein
VPPIREQTGEARSASLDNNTARDSTLSPSDAMLIFDPKKEAFSIFRMAYPMPFYTRGLDGRIDDAKAGWKGRGIWATYSSYLPKFTETRIGSVDPIQFRPSPLAN